MNPLELESILSRTLADGRLSSAERFALAEWFRAHIKNDQQSGIARHLIFECAEKATETHPVSTVLEWLEDVLKVLLPIRTNSNAVSEAPVLGTHACFSPGEACLRRITERLRSARRTVDICVFTITDDRIVREIENAHRRGVKIRIISDNDKTTDPGSDIERLRQIGVPIRLDETPYHMHHKFALFDQTRLLNGSYNWTRGAAEFNEENLTDTGDPALIAEFSREFEALWQKFA